MTRERVRLSARYVGHLGLRGELARRGVSLLSGLQVDPGFEGHLVLGLANLSARVLHVAYEEPIATLELHRLSRAASSLAPAAGARRRPVIPRAEADYLRTIESVSIPEVTRSLLRLSDNVATLSRDVRLLWIPAGAALLATILSHAV